MRNTINLDKSDIIASIKLEKTNGSIKLNNSIVLIVHIKNKVSFDVCLKDL